MPTYPSSVEPIGMKLESIKGYNVLIKPHLDDLFKKLCRINHNKKNKSLDLKNIIRIYIFISPADYNIIPFFKIADVLLTEPVVRFMRCLLAKPVIVNRFLN